MGSSSAVALRVPARRKHVLRDRKAMLRIARDVLGDDGVMATGEQIRPRKSSRPSKPSGWPRSLTPPPLAPLSMPFGGGVALLTALRHPEVVGRLVVVSTNIRRKVIYAEMLAQQAQVGPEAAEFMEDTPMYELYARVASRPEDFARLLGKIGEAMAKDFDFSDEIRGLQTPTLFVAADADMFPPGHAVEVFELLGGGQRDGGWMGEGRSAHSLAILPGVTHYNIFASPLLAAAVIPFLDAPKASDFLVMPTPTIPGSDGRWRPLRSRHACATPVQHPNSGPAGGDVRRTVLRSCLRLRDHATHGADCP